MHARSCGTHSNPTRHALELTVVQNDRLCDEHYRLRVSSSRPIDARPGQFVELRCERLMDEHGSVGGEGTCEGAQHGLVTRRRSSGPVLLPRPFSLAGLRTVAGRSEIDLIYRVVGPGTRWMAGLRVGDHVAALGPLGNCFDLAPSGATAYVIGGGVGLPPMIWLAECLRARGCQVVAFCGARTERLMALTLTGSVSTDPTSPSMAAEEFARHDTPVVLTTDDGSLGVKGLVDSAVDAYHAAHRPSGNALTVYTCGPEPMMRAVAAWSEQRDVPCQVCMERMMACGIGTCQSCVVAIRSDDAPAGFVYKLCCTDGPVFDAREVLWDQPIAPPAKKVSG